MKVQFKGILKKVYPAETIGKKQTKKVTIQVFRPGWTNEYNEKIGRDDHFEFAVFNDRAKESYLHSLIDQKVDVTGFLGTYEYDEMINNTKTGEKRYGLNLTLSEIQSVTK